jgi:hypothetical protein
MEMNDNIERLEFLLNTKTWDQLSNDEKALAIQELGSEEQYVLVRKIGLTLVSKEPGLSPDPKILKNLDEAIRHLHKPAWQRMVEWRIPAYTLLAPLLIIVALGVAWLRPVKNDDVNRSNVSPARDTLYLTQAPDTIFVDRPVIRYIERNVVPASAVFEVVKSQEPKETSDGVNMKENEELEKLLVSGS